jgi:hypothetical protein
VGIVGKLTVADEIEQQRSEEAFDKADSKLNRQFLMRRLEKERKAAEAERKKADAERAAAKEAKERKADPLYDERKAARAEAEKGATTKMVGGVKVTEYPSVEPVERRPTAQIRGGGGGGAGSLLREMNPQKLYNKGGAVKSASSRADGIAQRGKTRGRVR